MISLWELLLIAIIAVTILKPEQLGEIAQWFGRAYRWLQSSQGKIEKYIDQQNKQSQLKQNLQAAEIAQQQYSQHAKHSTEEEPGDR